MFDRFHDRLLAFFQSRGFAIEEARDLTQETLVRVFQHMGNLRDPGSLDAFVLRSAANLWKNELRSRAAEKRKHVETSIDEMLANGPEVVETTLDGWGPASPDALEEILSAERLQVVAACLDRLAPRRRTCLLLRLYQEMKYREIAALLTLSIESVKSHLHQGRLQLEECVRSKLEGTP